MEFELSKKMEKICKGLKLSAEQLAFADLCAVGWEPTDAYIVAFRKGSTWVKRALNDEVQKTLTSVPVQNRMAEVQSVLSERQKEAVKKTSNAERSSVVGTAMSKEQMLYDLQTAAATLPRGSKEWIDLKKLIVDVTRMKQDEVKDESNTIHHYLPVHYPTGCQDCLYQRCDSCKFKKFYEENKET